MKLFSDFRSCYCGTTPNMSPPLPLPADVQDGTTRRRRSKDLIKRSKTSSESASSSVWRPKLSAISEDHVALPPPPVEDDKNVEREEGGSRKRRWRRRRSSEFKKSETFSHGDDHEFVCRRKNSFSMAMRTFSATPFMM